jgi:hypothetical protein
MAAVGCPQDWPGVVAAIAFCWVRKAFTRCFAYENRPIGINAHDRRSERVPERIRDDLGLSVPPQGDQAIGRTKVNANNSHGSGPEYLGRSEVAVSRAKSSR